MKKIKKIMLGFSVLIAVNIFSINSFAMKQNNNKKVEKPFEEELKETQKQILEFEKEFKEAREKSIWTDDYIKIYKQQMLKSEKEIKEAMEKSIWTDDFTKKFKQYISKSEEGKKINHIENNSHKEDLKGDNEIDEAEEGSKLVVSNYHSENFDSNFPFFEEYSHYEENKKINEISEEDLEDENEIDELPKTKKQHPPKKQHTPKENLEKDNDNDEIDKAEEEAPHITLGSLNTDNHHTEDFNFNFYVGYPHYEQNNNVNEPPTENLNLQYERNNNDNNLTTENLDRICPCESETKVDIFS